MLAELGTQVGLVAEDKQDANLSKGARKASFIAMIQRWDAKGSELSAQDQKNMIEEALAFERLHGVTEANPLEKNVPWVDDSRYPLIEALNRIIPDAQDRHNWYLEKTAVPQSQLTEFEAKTTKQIANWVKDVNSDAGWLGMVLGCPPGINPDAQPTEGNVKRQGQLNSGYVYPEFPSYRFHPKGYEVGGSMPRYRLVTSHNAARTELSSNNRLLGAPKARANWFRWPGWRLGFAGFLGFVAVDYALGHPWSHHHHHHSDPRERYWYGTMEYSTSGGLIKPNLAGTLPTRKER